MVRDNSDEQDHELRLQYGPDVPDAIHSLHVLTKRIEMLAALNVLLLLGSVSVTGLTVFCLYGFPIWFPALNLGAVSSIIFFMGVIAMFGFDRWKRRGDSLFMEVSDELQWHLSANQVDSGHRIADRPILRVRIVLRNFVKNSDLPLTSGKTGALMYFAVYFLSWSMTMLFIMFFRSRGY